jgi:hypothetical protein
MLINTALAFFISPKSGPVRRMEMLSDAVQALLNDLSCGQRKQRHWLDAGLLLVRAAESRTKTDVAAATDALYAALVQEGWMDRSAGGDCDPAADIPVAADEVLIGPESSGRKISAAAF